MILCSCFKLLTIFILCILVIRSTCKSLNSEASMYYGVKETKPKITNQTLLDASSKELFANKAVVIVSSFEEEDDGTEYDNPIIVDEEPELQIKAYGLDIPYGNKSLYEKTKKDLESLVNNNEDMETSNTIFLPFVFGPRPGKARKGCRFRKRRGRKFGGGWQICDY